VQIYLPERAHDAHGVVRAIVKDSTDTYTEGEPQMFLDSDGQVTVHMTTLHGIARKMVVALPHPVGY
jgi:hypothetical protein